MKLSRKKAIELCIALWTWLAETGKDKDDWPEWEKYGDITCDCWFCEYDEQQKRRYKENHECTYCPFSSHCSNLYYVNWAEAITPRARKKYAKLFLKQIQSID